MMMNCFWEMVYRRKALSRIISRDHVRDPCHRKSPTRREQNLAQALLNEVKQSENHHTIAPNYNSTSLTTHMLS